MTGEAKTLIGIGLITLVIFVGGIVALTRNQPGAALTADPAILIREDSTKTGATEPKTILVEFGDYQCPFCSQSEPFLEELVKAYPDLQLVYRHFPLNQHLNAPLASEVAEAAGAQGKFWEMHSLLYAKQAEWAESGDPLPQFQTYAQELQLNMDQFNQAINEHTYRDKVMSDMADGNLVGVNSTPTFFLDGQRVTGGLGQLEAQIQSKLE